MSDTDQLIYLKKQITKQIAKRKSGVIFHRNKQYITAMITVVLSAIITISAGFKSSTYYKHFLKFQMEQINRTLSEIKNANS